MKSSAYFGMRASGPPNPRPAVVAAGLRDSAELAIIASPPGGRTKDEEDGHERGVETLQAGQGRARRGGAANGWCSRARCRARKPRRPAAPSTRAAPRRWMSAASPRPPRPTSARPAHRTWCTATRIDQPRSTSTGCGSECSPGISPGQFCPNGISSGTKSAGGPHSWACERRVNSTHSGFALASDWLSRSF